MLLLGVVAATLAFSSAPAGPATSASALAPRGVCRGEAAPHAAPALQVQALRCLIGWARRHGGQPSLHRSAALDRSAAMRADDVRRCQDFSHTPCGEAFIAVFEVVGYLTTTGAVGENLAWGQGRLGTARSAMRSWLASPPHRAILFTASWQDLGVARVHATSLFGRTNVTLWVAQFGHHLAPLPQP